MAKAEKRIMAWSKCVVEIGKTGDGDTMAATLTSLGTIKEKASSLEASEGDALEAKASGGETVAKEVLEGTFKFSTRVIEPTAELETLLGISEAGTDGDVNIKTHVIEGDYSLKVTPKNVGAKGIKAPKCAITYKPGWSEEEGNYADIDFEILKGDCGYWYSRFTKTA